MFTSLIIAAGGSSVRLGENKLFLMLGDMPILARTLATAQSCECVDEIIVAARDCDIPAVTELARSYGITKFKGAVRGGSSRQQSVAQALAQTNPLADYIAVHDADRPFASARLYLEVCRAAQTYGAAIPALAVTDTLKHIEDGFVKRTVDRSSVCSVQTPQVFSAQQYRRAMDLALQLQQDFTDDSQLIERCGGRVFAVPGESRNIKITVPGDMIAANKILEESECE